MLKHTLVERVCSLSNNSNEIGVDIFVEYTTVSQDTALGMHSFLRAFSHNIHQCLGLWVKKHIPNF